MSMLLDSRTSTTASSLHDLFGAFGTQSARAAFPSLLIERVMRWPHLAFGCFGESNIQVKYTSHKGPQQKMGAQTQLLGLPAHVVTLGLRETAVTPRIIGVDGPNEVGLQLEGGSTEVDGLQQEVEESFDSIDDKALACYEIFSFLEYEMEGKICVFVELNPLRTDAVVTDGTGNSVTDRGVFEVPSEGELVLTWSCHLPEESKESDGDQKMSEAVPTTTISLERCARHDIDADQYLYKFHGLQGLVVDVAPPDTRTQPWVAVENVPRKAASFARSGVVLEKPFLPSQPQQNIPQFRCLTHYAIRDMVKGEVFLMHLCLGKRTDIPYPHLEVFVTWTPWPDNQDELMDFLGESCGWGEELWSKPRCLRELFQTISAMRFEMTSTMEAFPMMTKRYRYDLESLETSQHAGFGTAPSQFQTVFTTSSGDGAGGFQSAKVSDVLGRDPRNEFEKRFIVCCLPVLVENLVENAVIVPSSRKRSIRACYDSESAIAKALFRLRAVLYEKIALVAFRNFVIIPFPPWFTAWPDDEELVGLHFADARPLPFVAQRHEEENDSSVSVDVSEEEPVHDKDALSRLD